MYDETRCDRVLRYSNIAKVKMSTGICGTTLVRRDLLAVCKVMPFKFLSAWELCSSASLRGLFARISFLAFGEHRDNSWSRGIATAHILPRARVI